MNRLQFIAEMKKSLLETTKEISTPFIEEKVTEIDHLAMKLVGLKWIKLEGINPSSFSGVRDHFINGVSVLLFSDGIQLIAYEKKCQSCNTILNWISFEKNLKCFSCDKTYSVEDENGDLACKRYYIKEHCGEWFIGL